MQAATDSALIVKRPRAWAYVAIMRPDHWFKNVFMLAGIALAAFYNPEAFRGPWVLRLGIGVAATCLCASSNYVLNEILDAPTDVHHVQKRHRPIPSGRVTPHAALRLYQTLLLAALVFAYLSCYRGSEWNSSAIFVAGLLMAVLPSALRRRRSTPDSTSTPRDGWLSPPMERPR